MQNKKLIVGSSLAVAVILAGAFSMSSAYKGDPEQKGPNHTEERHDAMTKSFENKDYDSWKAAMEGKGRVSEVIENEEDFEKFVEMRKLRLEGEDEMADEIKEELGLGNNGQGFGYGKGGKYGNRENDEKRGKNMRSGFVDKNGDGVCDHRPE